MANDVVRRVLIKVEADTARAERGMLRLDREALKAKLGMKQLGDQSKQAMDTIGLGAEAQVPRLQKINSAIQGFTGKLGQGLKGIDNFAKGLAPWNQALELGGKAVKFASESLDAYAKTSSRAADEVKKLKDEFEGYKNSIMAGTGFIVLELLKPAASFDELRRSMIRVENTALWQRLYGSGRLGMFEGSNEAADPLAALRSSAKGLGEQLDAVFGNVNRYGEIDGLAASFKTRMEETAAATKKGADEAARWRAELAALAGKNAKEVTDELVKRLELEASVANRASGQGGVDFGAAQRNVATAGQGIGAMQDAAREMQYALGEGRRVTFMESVFGPIEQIDLYKQSWEAFGSVF
jgi:hypothetical protein